MPTPSSTRPTDEHASSGSAGRNGREPHRGSVARQLLLASAAPLLATVALLFVVLGALNAAVAAKDRALDTAVPRVIEAHEVRQAAQSQALAARRFLLTGEPGALEEVSGLRVELEAHMAELRESVSTSELVESVDAGVDRWAERMERVFDRLARGATTEEVAPLLEQQVFPVLVEVDAAVERLIERETELLDREQAAAADDAANARILALSLGALAIVLGAGGALLTTRALNRRLVPAAFDVEAAGAQIASAATQQVSATSEQSVAVQQTVATVAELVQTAEETTARAHTLATLAEESSDVARRGTAAVQEFMSNVGDVDERVGSISTEMGELLDRTAAVSSVTRTVEEIAEQTHILSLNASIEAARAGEHGAGFAVVASEIRELADQSRRATGEIGGILGEIESRVKIASTSVEHLAGDVTAANTHVQDSGATISTLAETVDSVLVGAEQITAASRQQASATSQINEAMRDIETTSEQTLATARQLEQTADDLHRITTGLRGLVTTRTHRRRR